MYNRIYMSNAKVGSIIDSIFDELAAAEKKHPEWPEDKIHAVAIMVEEAGESMQAVLDYTYANGDIEHLKKELAQTGAMCLRVLMHL
ncbi:MAG: hypothetical protein C4K49_10685 [Candidatus Thorarchaeota archaeon]|nr:MAG: hypothetical protein C4K49_10685 [Candidatus Thorarchaeota archaeon]